MKTLNRFINESNKELEIRNNQKQNTFDICNLTGEEYALICQAIKDIKTPESDSLWQKIYNAEEQQ